MGSVLLPVVQAEQVLGLALHGLGLLSPVLWLPCCGKKWMLVTVIQICSL
jgi:hypothetical protein